MAPKGVAGGSKQRPWRIRVIVERSSGAVVGSINLKGPPNAEGDVEIGWGLNDDVSGKGYATEASAAVIDWVKKQPGVTTISATIPDDNHASKRLAGRLGFARTNDTRRISRFGGFTEALFSTLLDDSYRCYSSPAISV